MQNFELRRSNTKEDNNDRIARIAEKLSMINLAQQTSGYRSGKQEVLEGRVKEFEQRLVDMQKNLD